jgi:hypothetical protein
VPSPKLDLVKELRLRQWARENYVPLDRRSNTWHPVVLEEMHSRDVDLAQQLKPGRLSRYVPLAPSDADESIGKTPPAVRPISPEQPPPPPHVYF